MFFKHLFYFYIFVVWELPDNYHIQRKSKRSFLKRREDEQPRSVAFEDPIWLEHACSEYIRVTTKYEKPAERMRFYIRCNPSGDASRKWPVMERGELIDDKFAALPRQELDKASCQRCSLALPA